LRLGFRYAYGGQAMLVDLCVEAFLDALDETKLASRTLLSVCGGRGFPLGEHRRVGLCDAALYEELVHVPWLVRLPDGRGALRRSSAMVQPCDLFATLVESCGIAGPATIRPGAASVLRCVDDESWPVRDRACLFSPDGERAIRTPAWYLRVPASGAAELYAKPDDRWEANDVAVRCASIAEGLSRALDETVTAAGAGPLEQLAPLEESLVLGEQC
jgi:arylsulfatase A-like enzyme